MRILADGKFHSGEEIASSLGCTRSAVWKRVRAIRQVPGLGIDSVTGRGYRLQRPLELLDRARIVAPLQDLHATGLDSCEVLGSVDSTNTVASRAVVQINRGAAWFAEHQTAGRGRRGRSWVSPYGRNIYYSLAWRFDLPLAQLSGLSIACGAVLAEILQRHGLRGQGLKWPNDLLWDGRKIAGILLEVNGEPDGPASATIGVGINLDLGDDLQQQIGQPYASLRHAGLEADRNRLASDLLQGTATMCRHFTSKGLEPFLQTWRAYDVFRGQPVRLLGPNSELQGHCVGLADDGGLRLQVDGGVRTFYSGELSLRAGTGS